MRPRLRTEIREGMAYVWHHTMLRPIAFCTATSNLFSSMISAVYIVYAVRELHYAAGTIGLTFVFGGAGAVIGALVCARVTRPFGVGPTIVWSIFVSGIGMLLVGLAPRSSAFAWFVVGWALFSFTGVVYNVNQGSLRQVITAPRLQGRMNASMRFMVWGTMPFGALIGGALGTAIGLRPTLVVAGIGGMLAGFWVLCSPVRTLREMSDGPTTSGVEDTLVH
jgi:MFS family permease